MSSSRGLQGIISLFGFRGLSASPTAKSASDSGVGVDSGIVAQAIVGADVGVGAEDAGVVSVAVPGSDVGVGTEEDTVLAVTLSGVETGSGVDIGSYSVQAAKNDIGVGVESSSLTVQVSSSDVGVGVDIGVLAFDRMISVVITSIEPYRTIEYTLP